MVIGVNQKSSPIKICFLIKPNSKVRFERAMKIACSLWGGVYFPILPLYKKMPVTFRQEYAISLKTKVYYQNSIDNFDPDLVLYDEDLDEGYVTELIGNREIVKANEFLEELAKGHNQQGVNIMQIISSVISSDFKFERIDGLKLLFPKFQKTDLFLKSFLGVLEDDIENQLQRQLKSFEFFLNHRIKISNIANYLPNKDIGVLEFNTKGIRSSPQRHWNKGVAIYFLNEKRLNDINNYWNLRALGWNIIPVPINYLENVYFNNLLERFINWEIDKSNGITWITYLVSGSTTVKQKKKIDSKFVSIKTRIERKYIIGFQGWFPRFWEERSILEADKTLCENQYVDSKYEQVEVKDNYVRFKISKLPFELKLNHYAKFSYKTNLSFTYFDDLIVNAGLVYGIDSKDWIRLTHSYGHNKWRLSKSGLNYFIQDVDDYVHFYIPKALDFFKLYFTKRNHILKETADGQLANEVLKNIGGIRGSYFLKNLSSLKILELFENGEVISYPQLLGEIKKNLRVKNPEALGYIQRLIENKIIEFGAKLQCKICNQRTFYLPNELDTKLTCSICRNDFYLPMHNPSDIKWAYRGIGPFSKNNKVGGLMSVFLSLKLFNNEFADTTGNMSALIGFKLLKKSLALKEVDLAVLLQEKFDNILSPDLFLCECKTFKSFTSKDIERMKQLGEEFPNSILTFATLKEELLQEDKNEIKKLVKYFRKGVGNRPQNPVFILTAKELLPDNSFDPFSEYKNKIKPFHRYNDWIGNLCEMTVEKHLGLKTWGEIRSDLWVKEMKARNKKIKESRINAPQ
jgi:hypothetical protein